MSENRSLVLKRTVNAAPAEVCRAFTHATLLHDWLSDASSSDPRPGGHLFLRWRDGTTVTGSYEQLDIPHGLQFTWIAADLPAPSRVRVACEGAGEGTQLTLTHESLDGGGRWEAASSRLEAFWSAALENMGSVVETGIDLRQARRPRLGILIDEFTPEAARKLGVPVEKGILLGGTAEGSGAQAAGLLKGDVLVSLNNVPLLEYNSFDTALHGLEAGDRPIVEVYRGAEKFSVPIELGHFPLPELPASAPELAARVRELNDDLMAALRGQLEGLSEEQASARPSEGEWSAKELVAHLILMERDYQSWVADMLNDTPVEDWLEMRPNVPARIEALTARLPTLPDLLDELVLAREETAAMIVAFPASFASDRKHLFRRAALWEIEGMPAHYYDEHKEQFQAAIEAARG